VCGRKLLASPSRGRDLSPALAGRPERGFFKGEYVVCKPGHKGRGRRFRHQHGTLGSTRQRRKRSGGWRVLAPSNCERLWRALTMRARTDRRIPQCMESAPRWDLYAFVGINLPIFGMPAGVTLQRVPLKSRKFELWVRVHRSGPHWLAAYWTRRAWRPSWLVRLRILRWCDRIAHENEVLAVWTLVDRLVVSLFLDVAPAVLKDRLMIVVTCCTKPMRWFTVLAVGFKT
jgi:hypothetical protein